MGKKITNDLNKVSIGGNYIGGDNIMNYYYVSKPITNKEEEDSKTIFLSYNWNDVEVADKIDKYLSAFPRITVKRDIRDIGIWKSIREFMKSIRQQDYVVLIVSDLYLRSRNCMFEVMEVMKEVEYKDKIFPAVLEKGIYNPLVRVEYAKYWQQECNKLEAAIKELDTENIAGFAVDLRQYKSIASSIGEFLDIVADKNNPNIQEIEIQIEKAVLKNNNEKGNGI